MKITTKPLHSRTHYRTLFPGIGTKWGGDFQQGSVRPWYPLERYYLIFVGAGCRGTLTIKFDPNNHSWSNETFNEFRFLCQNAAKNYSELVGEIANNAVWTEAFEAAGVCHDDLIRNACLRIICCLSFLWSAISSKSGAEIEHQPVRRLLNGISSILPLTVSPINHLMMVQLNRRSKPRTFSHQILQFAILLHLNSSSFQPITSQHKQILTYRRKSEDSVYVLLICLVLLTNLVLAV